MKHFLIAGLLAAIGAVALMGPAHASGRFCRTHPGDPACGYDDGYSQDQGYNQDGDYDDDYDAPPVGRFYGDDNGYDDGYYQPQRRVSRCAWVGENLRRYGYHHIRPLDCGGSNYKYQAFKGSKRFILKVKGSSGRIIYAIRN